ncbi:MAG: DUF2335 domain-containing protein [Desulfobulbaceae bacterium]|jgi:uncharacterized membrane protein|nr:DUF2335 domain-containing protein [Desulfobulbaceae bacterium]
MARKSQNKVAADRRISSGHKMVVAQMTQHLGPLPHPDIFAQYNQIVPGAAERILAMAEANAEHTRTLEREALSAQIHDNLQNHQEKRAGQWMAFSLVILAFVVAMFALKSGYPIAAGIIFGTTIVAILSAFLLSGTRKPTAKNDE